MWHPLKFGLRTQCVNSNKYGMFNDMRPSMLPTFYPEINTKYIKLITHQFNKLWLVKHG